MARNVSRPPTSTEEKETPPEEVEKIPEAVPVITSEVQKPSAVDAEPPPPPKTFKVVKGGYILYDGCRSFMPEGKTVTETAYDLDLLRKQGIELELVAE